jgi:hypothetical protein
MITVPKESSERFKSSVTEYYRRLSNPYQYLLKDWEIIAVPYTLKAFPELLNTTPIGYPEGSTFNWAGAITWQNKIVISEYLINSKGWKKHQEIPGAIRHELAHAIDQELNYFSASPEFGSLTSKEIVNAKGYHKEKLSFHLNLKNELFADIVAYILGGCSWSSYNKPIKESFPKTIRLVQQKLKEISQK